MRCSLLALSSYIDAELDIEPTGELEAHLVACERCRTAIGYLREESSRIGGLARVHVPDDAVHDLFSQIGLIAEEDDLPEGPVHRDRPASVEAPPWFGAERGAALPWAPRPSGQEQSHGSQPRELIGERSPTTAVAEPPELLLWDEPMDQIATAVPVPPPVHLVPDPGRESLPDVESAGDQPAEPVLIEPQPPQLIPAEPQPPDLSTSATMVPAPRLAAGPNAFQRLRDAVAVRLALRRGAGSHLGTDVEIVSGAGAPRWNERAHQRHWSDSPAVVSAAAPPVVEPLSPPAASKRRRRFLAPVDDEPLPGESRNASKSAFVAPPAHETQNHVGAAATAPPELADVLSEVASLAAPLERAPIAPTDAPVEGIVELRGDPTPSLLDERVSAAVRESARESSSPHLEATGTPFHAYAEPASSPAPGRHVRRLHSQRSERREWNPTQPVTGRHRLPIGGPAVGAADRDRRLWLFGAATVILMLLGLLIGRQVTPTGPLVSSTAPHSTPTLHATTPATAAPSLPVATAVPAPTATIPTAPTPQQLTGARTLGTGSGGFTVADVRYGEHPNDLRLVFDLAYPDTVTGNPTTVIGYGGATTLYVEFTGVNGASNVAAIPPGQVVASIVPLPMARNTSRLIFKITLRKHAAFDAYYLSGARLVIDIT